MLKFVESKIHNTAPRSGRRCGLRPVLWPLLASWVFWVGQGPVTAEPDISKEYQIKAAFLYNFTKFIEWPAGKFADSTAPIVIGVIGSNPFGTVLADMIKDRKVNGRSIQFREINSVSEVRGLHVLFVPAAETRFGQLAEALREGSVLGVGESEVLLSYGGAILFVQEGDKLRFEINLNSAERAKLKISSQLLKLSRKITRTP